MLVQPVVWGSLPVLFVLNKSERKLQKCSIIFKASYQQVFVTGNQFFHLSIECRRAIWSRKGHVSIVTTKILLPRCTKEGFLDTEYRKNRAVYLS